MVAVLVFAPGAADAGRFEDCAPRDVPGVYAVAQSRLLWDHPKPACWGQCPVAPVRPQHRVITTAGRETQFGLEPSLRIAPPENRFAQTVLSTDSMVYSARERTTFSGWCTVYFWVRPGGIL